MKKIFLKSLLLATFIIFSAIFSIGYAEESEPISGINEFYKEESLRIAKYRDNVRRDGDTLYLKLKSGAKVTFINQSECSRYDTCWFGYFKEYIPDLDLYILMGAIYEGDYYLVVSGESGNSFSMYAYPEVSPDRLHMVVVLDDEMVGVSTIRLWRIEQSELIEEFYYNAKDLGYYNLNSFSEWQDNDTAIIKRYVLNGDSTPCQKSKVFEAHFALRHKGDTWELDKEPIEGSVNCNPDN